MCCFWSALFTLFWSKLSVPLRIDVGVISTVYLFNMKVCLCCEDDHTSTVVKLIVTHVKIYVSSFLLLYHHDFIGSCLLLIPTMFGYPTIRHSFPWYKFFFLSSDHGFNFTGLSSSLDTFQWYIGFHTSWFHINVYWSLSIFNILKLIVFKIYFSGLTIICDTLH